MVTAAVWPASSRPTAHTTSPAVVGEAHCELALTNVAPVGRWSVTSTDSAALPPVLSTVRVYATSCPTAAGSTLSALVRRSAGAAPQVVWPGRHGTSPAGNWNPRVSWPSLI